MARLSLIRALVAASLLMTITACPKDQGDNDGTIGPNGGSIIDPRGVTLDFPAGALSLDTLITIEESSAVVPNAVGPAFLIGPEGLMFAQPVRITLPFSPALAGGAEVEIVTAPHGSMSFTALDSMLAGATHVRASTAHLSIFCAASAGGSPSDLKIRPLNPTVLEGDTLQLEAIRDQDDLTATAMWSSSDPDVAIVSAGLATGRGGGETTITASVAGLSASTLLRVSALASIEVTPSGSELMFATGTTQQFHATGRYENGANVDISARAAWSSSNESVVTIDGTGLATRIGYESATIFARSSSVAASVDIAATCEPIFTGLKLSAGNPSAPHGFAIGSIITGGLGSVFWFDFDPALGEFGGTIYSNAGGSALSTLVLASGLSGVQQLAADDFYVYWSERGEDNGQGYFIRRIPIIGGMIETIYRGPPGLGGGARGLAVGNGFVYWADGAGNSTFVCPNGTCITSGLKAVPTGDITVAPIEFGRGPHSCEPQSCGPGFAPAAMIVDGSYIYGVESQERFVARVALGGDDVEIIGSMLSNPSTALAQDDPVFSVFDPRVYWADNGRIHGWPKSGGAARVWNIQVGGQGALAVDDAGFVYYVAMENISGQPVHGVFKRTGTSTPEVAAGRSCGGAAGFEPWSVAVDLNYLYIADGAGAALGSARVLKLHR